MGIPLERRVQVRHFTPKGVELVRFGTTRIAIAKGEVTPMIGLPVRNLNTGEVKQPLVPGDRR